MTFLIAPGNVASHGRAGAHVVRYVNALSVRHHGCRHAWRHADVLRQAGENSCVDVVGQCLSAGRRLDCHLDRRRREARPNADAGAECGGLRCLRYGLERLARLPRPQAESSRPGARRGCLGRRSPDAAARGLRTAAHHRRRDHRDLRKPHGRRAVVGAPPRDAKELAGDRGAGDARMRAGVADPARRFPAPAR
jgi:hypothetical protein